MKNKLLYIIVFAFLYSGCVKKDIFFYLPEGNYTGQASFVESVGIPDLSGDFIYKDGCLYSLSNDSIKLLNDNYYISQVYGKLIEIVSYGVVNNTYGAYVMKGRKVGDTYYFGCYSDSEVFKHGKVLKSEQVGTIILKEK